MMEQNYEQLYKKKNPNIIKTRIKLISRIVEGKQCMLGVEHNHLPFAKDQRTKSASRGAEQ